MYDRKKVYTINFMTTNLCAYLYMYFQKREREGGGGRERERENGFWSVRAHFRPNASANWISCVTEKMRPNKTKIAAIFTVLLHSLLFFPDFFYLNEKNARDIQSHHKKNQYNRSNSSKNSHKSCAMKNSECSCWFAETYVVCVCVCVCECECDDTDFSVAETVVPTAIAAAAAADTITTTSSTALP